MPRAMQRVVISGVGLYTPTESISNHELVESFNAWVEKYNRENADAIAAGELEAKAPQMLNLLRKPRVLTRDLSWIKRALLTPIAWRRVCRHGQMMNHRSCVKLPSSLPSKRLNRRASR